MKSSYLFIGLSLVLHALVIFWLAKSVSVPSADKPNKQQKPAIKAFLYKKPLAPPEPEPEVIEKPIEEELEKPVEKQPLEKPQVKEPTEQKVIAPELKTTAEDRALAEIKNPENVPRQNNVPARRRYSGSILEASKQIIQNQHISRDALQSSQQRFGKKSLSVMDGEPDVIDTTLPLPEEETVVSKPVEVNCDNAAAQGLRILSGLLGGRVKCHEVNGLNQYIDKRMKRETPEIQQ